MNFKQLVRDYFTFSRNERRGITILLVIIFLLAITNKLIFKFETPAKIDPALLDSASVRLAELNDSVTTSYPGRKLFAFDPNRIDSLALDSLSIPESIKQNLLRYRSRGGKFHSPEDFRKLYGMTDLIFNQVAPFLNIQGSRKEFAAGVQEAQLFRFDPNTASDDEFRRLGLTSRQITTIRNYQAKGGAFKSKDDFFRIYGLSAEQKRRFADYIQIETTRNAENRTEIRAPENLLFELNTVDSVQLEQLPGIGVKLSRRIVKYRELLGGFYSVNQLYEIYGLSEEAIHKIENKISINENKIRKLDLNFSEVGELARHPYLKKNLATRIVRFRSKYGKIDNPEVLRDSMILNIEEYKRIKPYL